METEKNNKDSVFATLNAINVNEHTEKKKNLTYLSWAWAWKWVKTKFPDASYYIFKDSDNRPYIYDDNLGYMCFTSVSINEETLEMWLPVMDGANKSMKKDAYTYSTRYGDKEVQAASMFDINKTIMRCLVKNLAMFGLGIYIYSGEDLPTDEDGSKIVVKQWITESQMDALRKPENKQHIQSYLDKCKVRPEQEKELKALL